MSKIPSGLMDEADVVTLILWCLLSDLKLEKPATESNGGNYPPRDQINIQSTHVIIEWPVTAVKYEGAKCLTDQVDEGTA